jgi:ADP-ribose pyrophosphatase
MTADFKPGDRVRLTLTGWVDEDGDFVTDSGGYLFNAITDPHTPATLVRGLEATASPDPTTGPDGFEMQRPWNVPWPEYNPVDITPPELRPGGIEQSFAEGWACLGTDPRKIDYTLQQSRALIPFDVVYGVPRNPTGRTGRIGRNLGYWGENQAADPIVVADTGAGRYVLLIRRSDCGQWAIPGGMVEPGEPELSAAIRELAEETGVDLTGVTGEVLFRGHVADPRQTDEAWVCSTVALYRVDAQLPATGADDALEARWHPFDTVDQLTEALAATGNPLYPAHVPLLTAAVERITEGATADV